MLLIGIDPGFGLTGMVAVSDAGVTNAATFSLPRSLGPVPVRTNTMAQWVSMLCKEWVSEAPDADVLIAIETPVLARTSNARVFGMQSGYVAATEVAILWQVQQLREAGLYDGLVVRLVEVGPSEAKKALTGDGRAKKAQMVQEARQAWFPASLQRMFRSEDDAEALADAVGIALAGEASAEWIEVGPYALPARGIEWSTK